MTRHPHYTGLTLVEMLLSLAAIGLIGGAIASMLAAVSYGTQESQDLRSFVVESKTLSARLTADVRKSRRVLHAGDDYIVLWVTDADADGSPSLHEIQRIGLNTDNQTLVSYEAADGAPDTEYELDDDFSDTPNNPTSNSDFPASVWGRNVTAFNITLDEPEAQDASLVSFRLTLSNGALEHVAVNAAALRN